MFGTSSNNQAEARTASAERACDHPDCTEAGSHRAPRSRDALDSYYWFCMDHARSYNAAWNFFGDMDRQAIEDYTKEDVTWHRPSWRMGGNRQAGDSARINAAWRRGDPCHHALTRSVVRMARRGGSDERRHLVHRTSSFLLDREG